MLTGVNAIVTGGTRGIGFNIAKTLLQNNASVIICSRSSLEIDRAVAELLPNGQIYGLRADVSSLSDCKRLVKFALKKVKTINVLINNAGIYGPIDLIEKLDLSMWQRTIEVNLMGAVYCSSLVIPLMKIQKRGKIINFCGAGVGSQNTMPHFTAYYTSKFAIAGFSQVLSDEVSPFGIQVNAISPGGVNTSLTDHLISQGKEKAGEIEYERAITQKKDGGVSLKLVTDLITFLSSSKSDHLTGRILSAKWDPPTTLTGEKSTNLYKLRRIDNKLFHETK